MSPRTPSKKNLTPAKRATKAASTAKKQPATSKKPAKASAKRATAGPVRRFEAKRPDALRNRERMLQAAYTVFAETGVDAQMTDIAAAAGVGVATLYRNFPTKEDLVKALLVQYMARAVEVARAAVEDPDDWHALVQFFQWITSLQLENRGLSEFLAGRIGGVVSPELDEQRHLFYEILEEVTRKAKDGGHLRPDVNVSDLRTVLYAIARVASSESQLARRAVLRFTGLILDGMRAPGYSKLEGPPLTTDEFDDVLAHRTRNDMPSSRAFKRGRRAWPKSG